MPDLYDMIKLMCRAEEINEYYRQNVNHKEFNYSRELCNEISISLSEAKGKAMKLNNMLAYDTTKNGGLYT